MFSLDSRLQQDTLVVGDFPLCRLLLMNDANYPWFILVPRREAVSELFQLDIADQQSLWQETTRLAEILKDAQTHPENYRNLLVRITGYNAYFTSIGRELQNEIIARESHNRY